MLALAALWPLAGAARAQSPGEGPGGPILVVTNDGENRFGRYYAEILRAEGLNEFAVAGVGALNAQTLAGYQVVLLGGDDADRRPGRRVLSGWVNGGGNLIAMRPDASSRACSGSPAPGPRSPTRYLKVDRLAARRAPGSSADTIQFHGDRRSLRAQRRHERRDAVLRRDHAPRRSRR